MDVRFYPPAPSATDSSRLGPSPYSDSSYCNKYDSESMFMPVPEPSQDFVPVNQFPSPKQTAAQWKRETPPSSRRSSPATLGLLPPSPGLALALPTPGLCLPTTLGFFHPVQMPKLRLRSPNPGLPHPDPGLPSP
ncbi:hypothetical protein PHYPO_G00056890 [Pangasianodon hypophthalmus]|uniref:Uncharacterized protein n=1 Tax=Pangasianodon hypophthalmus TaxID=310915 RepID=A0A5N5M8H4_PANHP|nr:hypothetical protein PHYPO_G00056890 [Pangasianodon hypophthalmus]